VPVEIPAGIDYFGKNQREKIILYDQKNQVMEIK